MPSALTGEIAAARRMQRQLVAGAAYLERPRIYDRSAGLDDVKVCKRL
jgi:hypothetical protein